jgi:iron complex outermembrane receptor protein
MNIKIRNGAGSDKRGLSKRKLLSSFPKQLIFLSLLPIIAPTVNAGDESATRTEIEEIIVMARKRSESSQEVPVSMVALSGAKLAQNSIDSFVDVGNAAPNIEINGGIPNGGGSATQIFIRGVGQDDYSFPNEPGVGMYIDDVYVARSAGGDFGFLDIERIEILRGPQGTLYGRNTIGGAVKIVTSKPDGTTSSSVSITGGDYSRMEGNARVQFPVSDNVSAKIAVGKRKADGLGRNLINQDLGNTDQTLSRGAIRIQPNDKLDILFSADYLHQRQNGPAGSMVAYVPNGTGAALINPLFAASVSEEFGLEPPFNEWGPAWVKTLQKDGKGVYNSGGAEETRDWATIWGAGLTIDKSILDTLDFKSITAYRESEIDIRRDSEHTPFRIVRVDNPENTDQFTQEFQLTSQTEKLAWVAGVFYLKENGESELFAPLIQGTFGLIGLDLEALINTDYNATSFAVYGEGTYELTDRLALTAGGRWSTDDKTYIYGMRRPPSGAVPLPPTKLESDWSEFLPKVGLEFHAQDGRLYYASASRGYKAGGYNSRALSGNPPAAYDPEFITAFEIGFKSQWADNRVILNGAAFYNDYKDIQLLSVLDLGGGNVETVIENAAKGRIVGGELELTALPADNLEIGIGFGFLDTKYKQVDESASSAGIALGNQFINAPKVSANASINYTIPVNTGDVILHLDVVYRDKQFRDAVNTAELRADAYTLLNGRITFATNERWEVAAFVTNITDKIYVTSGVSVLGLEYTEAYYSRPREWGLTVTYSIE